MVKLPPPPNVAFDPSEPPVKAPVENVSRPRFGPAKLFPLKFWTLPTCEGDVKPELEEVARPLLPIQTVPPWLVMLTLLASALRGRTRTNSASTISFFMFLRSPKCVPFFRACEFSGAKTKARQLEQD
jgi:hypothetical protein